MCNSAIIKKPIVFRNQSYHVDKSSYSANEVHIDSNGHQEPWVECTKCMASTDRVQPTDEGFSESNINLHKWCQKSQLI